MSLFINSASDLIPHLASVLFLPHPNFISPSMNPLKISNFLNVMESFPISTRTFSTISFPIRDFSINCPIWFNSIIPLVITGLLYLIRIKTVFLTSSTSSDILLVISLSINSIFTLLRNIFENSLPFCSVNILIRILNILCTSGGYASVLHIRRDINGSINSVPPIKLSSLTISSASFNAACLSFVYVAVLS
ncbi:hypothetical protein NEIRO03_2384 [Nematocida sp. AWRm78]|nr:hypothetical protein NEIRO03_2384 [Nematocida sp. AWRm78]